jgi:hypothetical protein
MIKVIPVFLFCSAEPQRQGIIKMHWVIVSFCVFFLSCDQSPLTAQRPLVSVLFSGKSINFQSYDGKWDSKTGKMFITARGYNREQFGLSLVVSRLGCIQPQTGQIYFSDGLAFLPDSVSAGTVCIDEISEGKVHGTFKVSFANSFQLPDLNSIHHADIEGGFTVY